MVSSTNARSRRQQIQQKKQQINRKLNNINKPQKKTFEGSCDGLNGFIYNISNPRKSADMFTQNKNNINIFLGSNHPYGDNVQNFINKQKLTNTKDTQYLPTRRTTKSIWEK